MLWQVKAKLIIQLCAHIHDEVQQCCQYYPPDPQHGMSSPDFEITCLESVELVKNFTKRRIRFNNKVTKESRVVTHFIYTDWPSYGNPPDEELFVLQSIIRTIFLSKDENPDIPPVIHCSDGCGKTGTIIAMAILTQLLRKLKYGQKDLLKNPDYNISIFAVIRRLREQRINMAGNPNFYCLTNFLVDNCLCKMIH